jgi:hypothetical protein
LGHNGSEGHPYDNGAAYDSEGLTYNVGEGPAYNNSEEFAYNNDEEFAGTNGEEPPDGGGDGHDDGYMEIFDHVLHNMAGSTMKWTTMTYKCQPATRPQMDYTPLMRRVSTLSHTLIQALVLQSEPQPKVKCKGWSLVTLVLWPTQMILNSPISCSQVI